MQFALTLVPIAAEEGEEGSSTAPALRRFLAPTTTTTTAASHNCSLPPQAILALRSALLTSLVIPTTASQGSAAQPLPVIDQVLLAACSALSPTTGLPFTVLYTDSSPENTAGNAYASMAALMASKQVQVNETVAAGAGAGGSAGSGGRRAAGHSARRLALQLQPLPPRAFNATQQQYTFNVLTATSATAEAMQLALIGPDTLPAVLDSVVTSLANATGGGAYTAAVPADSVHLISMTYQSAFWMLLWDLFLRNIQRVVGGACAVVLVVLVLACFNTAKRAYALGARANREAALKRALEELQEANRASSRRAGEGAWGGEGGQAPPPVSGRSTLAFAFRPDVRVDSD